MDFLQIKVALEIAQTRITLPLFTLAICSFEFNSLSLSCFPLSLSNASIISLILYLSHLYK